MKLLRNKNFVYIKNSTFYLKIISIIYNRSQVSEECKTKNSNSLLSKLLFILDDKIIFMFIKYTIKADRNYV
jgi:hypothetical protein